MLLEEGAVSELPVSAKSFPLLPDHHLPTHCVGLRETRGGPQEGEEEGAGGEEGEGEGAERGGAQETQEVEEERDQAKVGEDQRLLWRKLFSLFLLHYVHYSRFLLHYVHYSRFLLHYVHYSRFLLYYAHYLPLFAT